MRNTILRAAVALAAFCGAGAANAQTATQDINISATVASYCTINNITGPAALTATIPVTNGVVTTTAIPNTIASVACNNAADVIASSVSGGVTLGGAAASGTTNIIDYTGVATFASAASTIDTATVATAAGTETGNTAVTSGAATGNLSVTITPAQPALPLMPGATYADTLRVTLTAH
ncbi:MAG: hypothetical protein ABL907_25340 [Hyphomicrobium sp.]